MKNVDERLKAASIAVGQATGASFFSFRAASPTVLRSHAIRRLLARDRSLRGGGSCLPSSSGRGDSREPSRKRRPLLPTEGRLASRNLVFPLRAWLDCLHRTSSSSFRLLFAVICLWSWLFHSGSFFSFSSPFRQQRGEQPLFIIISLFGETKSAMFEEKKTPLRLCALSSPSVHTA